MVLRLFSIDRNCFILLVQVKSRSDKNAETKIEDQNFVFQFLTKTKDKKNRNDLFCCPKAWKTKKRKYKFEFHFQCSKKMENKNQILNSLFQWRGKMENKTGSSNSVFPCHRKTVGTKVDVFVTLWI